MFLVPRRAAKICASASLAFLLSACMTVQLVGDYDENIDTGANELQHKLSEFFVDYQSAEPDGRRFSANQAFYKESISDLDALQARAAAIRKNQITVGQLEAVKMNLALLALLHKNCVTSPSLSDDQRKAILENGPDASLNCQIKSGADANLSQRGDQQLNPVMIPNLKSQFESALGAVVAFEVMKKRGKKEQ